MLRRLNRLISGGKRVKLIKGPGDNLTFILDGKAQSLEYEINNKKHYYRWSGLTDGVNDLYTYLGMDNIQQQADMNLSLNNILTTMPMNNNKIFQNKFNTVNIEMNNKPRKR
jgi:hypothetical protein